MRRAGLADALQGAGAPLHVHAPPPVTTALPDPAAQHATLGRPAQHVTCASASAGEQGRKSARLRSRSTHACTISYRAQEKQRQRVNDVRLKREAGLAVDAPAAAQAPIPPVCRIVYASRTHSQLQQVARELDKTAYSRVRRARAACLCFAFALHVSGCKRPLR